MRHGDGCGRFLGICALGLGLGILIAAILSLIHISRDPPAPPDRHGYSQGPRSYSCGTSPDPPAWHPPREMCIRDRCLNFLETPDSGRIAVRGRNLLDGSLSPQERRRNRLHFGLVFQDFNLFPQYTALELSLIHILNKRPGTYGQSEPQTTGAAARCHAIDRRKTRETAFIHAVPLGQRGCYGSCPAGGCPTFGTPVLSICYRWCRSIPKPHF